MTNSNHPGPDEIAAHAAVTAGIVRDAEIDDLRAKNTALRRALLVLIDPEAGEADRRLALKDVRALFSQKG